jgi:DNA-binding CsgD family transcriptional regulator/Tfp pilus assembly protein PilF
MQPEVFGRAAELSQIERFLAAPGALPGALLLEGEAGIGKTTLWRHGVAGARGRSWRVLSCAPAESEVSLSFAGLADLLGGGFDEVAASLPAPQRRALRVALALEDARSDPAEQRTVSAGFLEALLALARHGPVLVAVDDVQWLDRPSASVLEFAARRLGDEQVGLLLARRVEQDEPAPLGLDRHLPPGRLHHLPVAPLGLDALHEVLHGRLGRSFPRRTLHRLHQVSAGNPLYALELARALPRVRLAADEPLPLPGSLRELAQGRLVGLAGETSRALLLCALAAEPTVALVSAAMERDAWACLRPAAERGVVELEGERVRFVHPLFASAILATADLGLRRDGHRRLAAVLGEGEQAAQHLALAAEGPDREVAKALEAAAATAADRGAPVAAAELLEQAIGLTPAGDTGDAQRRLADAGRAWFIAGDGQQALTLLKEALAKAPAGPLRARVRAELATVEAEVVGSGHAVATYRQALMEAEGDAALQADISQRLTVVLRFTEGTPEFLHALGAAVVAFAERSGDPSLLSRALTTLAQVEFNAGLDTREDLLDRALALDPGRHAGPGDADPRLVLGHQLLWSGRLEEARAVLEPLRATREANGDVFEADALWYLSLVDLRLGDWDGAERLAERATAISLQSGFDGVQASMLYPKALLAAYRGEVDTARAVAERGISHTRRTGERPVVALHQGVLGFVELSLGNPAAAVEHLRVADRILYETGMREPGMGMAVLPDLIEALILLDRTDEAAALLGPWAERARSLDRAVVLAAAGRCRAQLAAAAGDLPAALAAVEEALEAHQRVPEPFALARTLLVAGAVRRRARRKALARQELQRARDTFERLGALLWTARAVSELARIGGRSAHRDALTPTERRVAELGAKGHANKQIASALFCSAKTIEGHLSRIYAKVGVRSRTELARRLASYRTYG